MAGEILTPDQCRAARALLGMSQMELSEAAGITHKPLVDFERGQSKRPYPSTLKKLRDALEEAGVIFVEPNGQGSGVRLDMRVWRLEPVDLDHRDWKASTHKGPVVIRAENERRARQRATMAFLIAVERTSPHEDTALNPWSQPERATCAVVEGGAYETNGPEEILDPAEAELEIEQG